MTKRLKLQDLLIQSATLYPDRYAVCINQQFYNYQYIFTISLSIAKHMQAHGLRLNDRVAVIAGNSMMTVLGFWSVIIAGGIVSILSKNDSDEKLTYILNDLGARLLVTNMSAPRLSNIINNVNTIKLLYIDDEDCINMQSQSIEVYQFEYNHAVMHNVPLKNDCSGEKQLASIIYTSGSTGCSKGVMMTHQNMLAAVDSINQYLSYRKDDVILSVLPLSFDYGLYQMILAFDAAATLVLEENAFFPVKLLRMINQYHITILPVVPTLLNLLVDCAKKFPYHCHTVRLITSTGSKLYLKTIINALKVFALSKFIPMYGLTECKRCSYLPFYKIQDKYNSVGVPIPGVKVFILNEAGDPVEPGTIGEIVVSSPTVMQGYWNDPVTTNKVITTHSKLNKKILFTGDYGYIDKDGYIYLKGRNDELIKYHGKKVYPIEIESIVTKILEVNEVALVPFTASNGNIQLNLFITKNCNINAEDLIFKIKQKLPSEYRNLSIYILANLPLSQNGKIDKKKLLKIISDISTCPIVSR